MCAYTHHIFYFMILLLLLYVKSLLGPEEPGFFHGLNPGPARQRFDLTFKNSSRTFHEAHVNFYCFVPPSFEMIIILLRQERGL